MFRFQKTASLFFCAALVGLHAPISTAALPDGEAISTASALAAGESGIEFSPKLVAGLGYEPGTENGLATDPAGECSSPIPLPKSFTPACRVHDLGYDLLRVADRNGEYIPLEARRELDRQLAQQMSQSCTSQGCRLMAGAAQVAVGLNSLRQGYGAPVEEKWSRWLPW